VTRLTIVPLSAGALIAATLASTPAVAATDDARSRATVLRPITVVRTGDLDFGTILRGTTAGRVVINASTGARTVTGGVLVAGGTPRRATFTITGTPRRVVTIRLTPTSTTLTNGNGGTMLVNAFTLNGSANRRLSATGSIALGVGARLNVAANQADGNYTGTFNLTINYQ
jgi:hypothetical protein